jgi:hypothetical protein
MAADSRQRYGLLLAALILTLLAQGMLPAGEAQQLIASALVGATLVLALRAAGARPLFVGIALVAAVAAVISTIVQAATGEIHVVATAGVEALFVAVAPPAVAVGVLRSLRRHQRVHVEAVMGVLCLYLLFGMLFSFVYAVLNHIDEPFFSGGAAATASQTQYFSFVTLTTVGYGDLTARSQVGHTLAVLEALLGQIYLVTVVSLIVSNVGRARRQ